MKAKDEIVRSFQSKGPDWLKPKYDIFQQKLDDVLANENYCEQLIKIDFKSINSDGKRVNKQRKVLWDEVKDIIGNPLKGYINNSAWYNRMLAHNLLSIVRSRQDQIKIYQLLKNNEFKIDSKLRTNLADNNLYPHNSYLKNLAKTKKMPQMPSHAVAKLDYSVSDKQMFVMDDNLTCLIQVMSKLEAKQINEPAWKTFQIYLPTYLRPNIKKICKPIFTYSNGHFICQVPYYLDQVKVENRTNILGVDLGRVKLFSATVLQPDGTFSDEFVPSNELTQLNEKLHRLQEQIDALYDKNKLAEDFHHDTQRLKLRKDEYSFLRQKRTRLKEKMEWLIAEEIVYLASSYHCKEIHLENLTWVNNRGGKWDFSAIQLHIKMVAELTGIDVILVNPKNTSHNHPLTNEYGRSNQREIVFRDGFRVDRDQLASLNIALRSSNIQITKFYKRNSIKTKRPRRRNLNKIQKKQVLSNIQSNQIVLVLSSPSYEIAKLNHKLCFEMNNNLLIRNEFKLCKISNNS